MAGRPPFDGFNPDSEDIESYLERLQEYFIAYDIKSETETVAKRRAILLTSIGSNVYRVLKDLSYPDAPNTKTFDQLPASNATSQSLQAYSLKSRGKIQVPFC